MPGDEHVHNHNHSHAEEVEKCITVSTEKSSGFQFGDSNKWHFAQGHDHSHHLHDMMSPSTVQVKKDNIDDTIDQSPTPKENINLRAAYLHVLSDLVQSIAVLIAGVVIWYKPELSIIDPFLSIIFCPIIFYSTLGIIRSSIDILLEGAPQDVDLFELQSSIMALDGVTSICDLHVWSISHGAVAMTAHIQASNDPALVMRRINRIATSDFGIGHCTLQVFSGDCLTCGPGMNHCWDLNKTESGEYELVEQNVV